MEYSIIVELFIGREIPSAKFASHIDYLCVNVGTAFDQESNPKIQNDAQRQTCGGQTIDQRGNAAGGHDGDSGSDKPAGDHPNGPAHFRIGIAAHEHPVRQP